MTRAALLIIMALVGVPLSAEAPEFDHGLFGDVGYEFHIFARLFEQEGTQVWNSEFVRRTISGRTVTVQLEGDSIVVLAKFTPYDQDGDTVMLVAQGQTWLSVQGTEGVRYRTAFKSLPLALGESLFFFPLGVHAAGQSSDSMNLELEVQLHKVIDRRNGVGSQEQ
ncbi:hypothetical protein [Spirochaeta africana]|uniref:Uncharacterized protein n=1 Tax=Spirochaeta africana (strain ATCC 700263 / DSM 8902 / Z-7692) TaxID=889378 RepID=H9ULX5_SPIAZ|nr:hypothetical protein [Spirochaeta africana]AFG38518.1 hypothetical protein Spiaf_2487 [Spirochaeta africana DSM 8902]